MISSIRLQYFRSYKDAAFEFEKDVNIIVGPNACGKTNLLEAILVLSKGSSYRAKDNELLSFNERWSRLEMVEEGHLRVLKLQLDQFPLKTFDIDGKIYKRLGINSRISVVLFEPNHLLLLTGSKDLRRSFLDDLLEQINEDYSTSKRHYQKALAQRNSLLKTVYKNGSKDQLFPWNIRLSQLAGNIVKNRSIIVEKINLIIQDIYSDLADGNKEVKIIYKPQLPVNNYESHHLNKLESLVDDDIRSGFTAYGPHRDDFVLTYNGIPANLVASRGEMRTGVLALKLSEIEIIEKELGKKAIFLLDDVFSELDGHRRHALIKRLRNIQSFITTTDADIVIKELAEKFNVIAINDY